MEALTAFSLAGTILEFARFSIDLLSDVPQLYKSSHGALSANQKLEFATADLRTLLVKLQTRESRQLVAEGDEGSQTFQQVLSSAENTASELLGRLESLKVKHTKNGKAREWESVQKAVENAFTKAKREALKEELARAKDAVQTHVLCFILDALDEASVQRSERFDQLDKSTQLIVASLLDVTHRAEQTTKLSRELQDQMATLLQVVRRVDTVDADGNRRPRSFAATQELVSAGMAQRGEYVEATAIYEMLDVSETAEASLRREVYNDILAALAYPSMTERYEDIGDAFPETFKWAFEGSSTGKRHWDNFPEWLKTGSGVYWVGGKAGSGKSTLLKHIFDDNRTRNYLEQWAKTDPSSDTTNQDIPFCLATFFFWNSGTVEQKSQTGLLRALLYQVLSHFPPLLPVVFPKLWAKRYLEIIQDTQEKGTRLRKFDETLTLGRLKCAFQNLTRQSMVPLKVCFLIDGLDEYSGDHEELALLFKMTTQSPLIKVCVSSRPWVIFEQIYGSHPSMRLQDLTYNDIQHYVTSKFDHNSAFARLQGLDPESAKLLRNEVIERAEGVFLWVEIVVRSLLLGIRNQDDIAILRRRLMAMPQELESLYSHLLGLIEGVYWVWASKAFQIVRATRDLCNDDASNPVYRAEGSTTLTLSTFFFAMAERVDFQSQAKGKVILVENITPTKARAITPEIVEDECNVSKIHLTARCAGLLEVPQFERKGAQAPIRFHHRTAREFLYDNVRWKQLLVYTQDISFDPHRTLFKASVLELANRAAHPDTESGEMYSTVIDSVLYAYHVNMQNISHESETRILDTLDQIMTGWAPAHDEDWAVSKKMPHWTARMIDDRFDYSYHLSAKMRVMKFATVYGLKKYVSDKLAELGPENASESASLLLALLQRRSRSSNFRSSVSTEGASQGRVSSYATPTIRTAPWDMAEHPFEQPEMVSILIQHGASPKDGSSPNPVVNSIPRVGQDVLSCVCSRHLS